MSLSGRDKPTESSAGLVSVVISSSFGDEEEESIDWGPREYWPLSKISLWTFPCGF